MKHLIFVSLFFSSLSFAQVASSLTLALSLSDKGVSILKSVGEEIGSQGVAFSCVDGVCHVTLDRLLEPEMDTDLIERPFVGGLLALRVYGGSQNLQRTVYDTIGKHTETNVSKAEFDERVLKIDDGLIKFRCTSTREKDPVHECWIVIGGKAVVLP